MSKLSSKRYKGVIGIDEVGRGPLAGPVTLCAVYVKDGKCVKRDVFADSIRDSKMISKHNRIKIYQTIIKNRLYKINSKGAEVVYVISSRSAAYIDKVGISQAISQCLVSCMRGLAKKGVPVYSLQIRLDAGLRIPIEGLKQKNFVKGDERFVEIALASIVAKVTRDRYMDGLSREYGEYGWHTNAGYGTPEHCRAIQTLGVTKYHRRTYLKAFKLFDKAE